MTRYGMTTPYEVLTPGAPTCSPDTSIRDVAHAMADEDGEPITVIVESGEPDGVVTDRGTTVRLVVRGWNPLEAPAAETVSEGAWAVCADDVVSD